MGEKEKEAQLHRQARPLAVEAAQLGVPPPAVLRIVKEELEALKSDRNHE
jgi:hypothetical protein